MPKVTILYKERTYESNVPTNMNVLIGATMSGLDELGFGDCGGNLVCATCHVRVKSGTFPAMKSDEEFMLETLPSVFADSRLACQLKVQEDCVVEWVG
ncbi:MAG: ferredoxin [Pseudomonas fluorescens]|nr:MAG: ferredoxin [Pseudomonas fluorescens]